LVLRSAPFEPSKDFVIMAKLDAPTSALKSTKPTTSMKAFVYNGPGKTALEDRQKPEIMAASDAIIRVTKTTICGTDLHARPHPGA
jgi:hypothetical protein